MGVEVCVFNTMQGPDTNSLLPSGVVTGIKVRTCCSVVFIDAVVVIVDEALDAEDDEASRAAAIMVKPSHCSKGRLDRGSDSRWQ